MYWTFALTFRGLPLSWTEWRVRLSLSMHYNTHVLNVRVGHERSSRGFGQIEELDVINVHWSCSSPLVVGWSRVVASCSTSRVAELLTLASHSHSHSHLAADGQSVSTSWCRAHFGTSDQSLLLKKRTSLEVSVLSVGGALSDERSGLSFVILGQ
jgi:hypothetical protein